MDDTRQAIPLTVEIHQLPMLLGVSVATAVNCCGLLVPCRALPSVLARSVRPLVFENDDEYRYSMRGSCTLVRSDRAHVAVFTEHQRQGQAPAQIRIVSGFSGGNCLTAETYPEVDPRDGEEYEDLRGLKIAVTPHSREELADFYPLPNAELPPVQGSRMLIAIGLPAADSGVDYDPMNVRGGTIAMPCSYLEVSTHVRGFHSVQTKFVPGYENWPVDGMSGGAVFSIDGIPANYSSNLRGIVLRGGADRLHYIDIAARSRRCDSDRHL